MFALTTPPEPPRLTTIPGYVVQVQYAVELERLVPFDPEDEDFDLRFRDWFINGFATRRNGADDIHQTHLAAGWKSRILPGIAEQDAAGKFTLFTMH